MRLLEEAEHQKLIVTRQILEERLHEVRKDNVLKEQELLNIRKQKECTLGEVHQLEEEFVARVSYLVLHHIFMYFLTFTGFCIYSYIISLYVYFLILCHVFFAVFDRKR